jgi:hypothetical protein
MNIRAASSGDRPMNELTEDNLMSWVADLPEEFRSADLRILVGSPVVGLIARRIVEAPVWPKSETPKPPLYGMFTVIDQPALPSRSWKAVAIANG